MTPAQDATALADICEKRLKRTDDDGLRLLLIDVIAALRVDADCLVTVCTCRPGSCSYPSASAGPQEEAVAWRYRWADDPEDDWDLAPTEYHLPTDRTGWEIEPLYAHPQPQQADAVAWGAEFPAGRQEVTLDPDVERYWRETLKRPTWPLYDKPQQADGRGAVIEALRDLVEALPTGVTLTYGSGKIIDHTNLNKVKSRAEDILRTLSQAPASAGSSHTRPQGKDTSS